MSELIKNVDKIHNMVYDGSILANGGATMTSRDILWSALKVTNLTQAEAAARVGMTPQQLCNRLSRNTLRADELFDILENIGIDVIFTVRESGECIKEHIYGAGRRVRMMVDKVVYDTANANALANDFYSDGENEYTNGRALELYIDQNGRYFFAEYSTWEGVKDRIIPVSATDAAEFIEKNGTEIHKKPKMKA